jgi:hypothetical protein
MARSSFSGSVSCDGAINSHCRYLLGIVTPKIGDTLRIKFGGHYSHLTVIAYRVETNVNDYL